MSSCKLQLEAMQCGKESGSGMKLPLDFRQPGEGLAKEPGTRLLSKKSSTDMQLHSFKLGGEDIRPGSCSGSCMLQQPLCNLLGDATHAAEGRLFSYPNHHARTKSVVR